MITLKVQAPTQTLSVYDNNKLLNEYPISTGKKGLGEVNGSEQTPRGLHMIRAKIGAGCSANTVFIKRRPTGEIYSPALQEKFPERDWILTRILWLSGLEVGKNRLGNVDSMRRFIYIHGTPDEVALGQPASHGCIRMHNHDLIELFDFTPIYTRIFISE